MIRGTRTRTSILKAKIWIFIGRIPIHKFTYFPAYREITNKKATALSQWQTYLSYTHQLMLRKRIDALVPPKPKLLESAYLISRAFTSKRRRGFELLHAGSIFSLVSSWVGRIIFLNSMVMVRRAS